MERLTSNVGGSRKPTASAASASMPTNASVHCRIFIVVPPAASIEASMCSRYFLDADGNIIAYTFRVPANTNVRKRFNIAPTQEAPVIRLDREGRPEVALLRWGLVPFWAKDLKA